MNQKKVKTIRKTIGYHPTDLRGYSSDSTGRRVMGSRAAYIKTKKLTRSIENGQNKD